MIIGLGHRKQKGKDTVGKILVEEHGFTRVAFADALKELALKADPLVGPDVHVSELVEYYGWETAKSFKPETREFLQRLGVAARDVLGPDTWVAPVINEITLGVGDFVITDVRFKNEAAAIKAMGGYVVRVDRDVVPNDDSHVSERELARYKFDDVIKNNGTFDDLGYEVARVLEQLRPPAQPAAAAA